MPLNAERLAIVAQARKGCVPAVAAQIHYPPGDVRTGPAPLMAYKHGHWPITLDCSQFAQCVMYAAGAPDPMGYNYDLAAGGNTVTMYDHLPHISASQALPGDCVIYGPGGADHVVVITSGGDDPMVVSHGQEAGPIELRQSTESAAHRGPVTYVRTVPIELDPMWRVVNGKGEVLTTTKHPVAWLVRHPRCLRKYDRVTFDRRG